MKRPEYWESDEKWAEYEAWQSAQPAPPEPLSHLQQAIDKARGTIRTEEDLHDAIRFCNQLSDSICGRSKPVADQRITEACATVAAAYWLDCSPHEQTTKDGIVLAKFCRQAVKELADLRHACLAALGYFGGVSLLSKEQIQKTLANAVRSHVNEEKK